MSEVFRSGARRSPTVVLLAVALVVWFLSTALYAHVRVPPTAALPDNVDQVVIFGIPGLTFDELDPAVMPHLAALAKRGAVAGTNVRTGSSEPSVAESYASVGAGYRLDSGSTGEVAVDGGAASDPAVRVLDMPKAVTRNGTCEDGQPGALADALHASGLKTGVVSNADVIEQGVRQPRSPAALAAAGGTGEVDAGTVGPRSPRGPRRSWRAARLAAGVHRSGSSHDGRRGPRRGRSRGQRPMARVRSRFWTGASAASVRQMFRRTDAVIGQVDAALGPRSVLMVVGVTPPTSTWALTPMVLAGDGIEPGHLSSPSTHRGGLVTLLDVAPTALSLLATPEPSTMSGHPLRLRPGGTSLRSISSFNEMLVSRRSTDQPLTLAFIIFQTCVYLGVLVAAEAEAVLSCGERADGGRARSARRGRWRRSCFGWSRTSTPSARGAGGQLVARRALAFAATRFRSHRLDPLLFICGATVAVLVCDLSMGAHLQYGSFFGYAPNKGMRFTGVGNAAFAILAGSTIVVCVALLDRARDRRAAWWVAVAVALCVIIADGAPWMGADVGGILTLVPIFGLLLWALRGGPVRWRALLTVVAATVVALAIAVGLDAMRAPDQRTHVSRFFLQLGDRKLVRSTISEKWSQNIRLLQESMWAWLVPATAAFSLVALSVGGLWQRALPSRSPQRYAVIAPLALGLLGWLLNDSGIVVVALASMYLGPFVLLLARDEELHDASLSDREGVLR